MATKRSFRFRYSLRSYLILVGVVGLLVLPVAQEWRTVSREKTALRNLPQSSVHIEWKDDASLVTRVIAPLLQRFEPNAGKRVKAVSLAYIGEFPLHHLAEFHALERVEFGTNITLIGRDQFVTMPSVHTVIVRDVRKNREILDLEFLDQFPNLRSLALRSSALTPKAVERIERSQIESLEFNQIYFDEPLPRPMDLSGMQRLRRLKTDYSVLYHWPEMINSATRLRQLTVDTWANSTKPALPALDLPELRSAEIYGMKLRVEDLAALARQPQLKILTIGTHTTEDPPLEPLEGSRIESLRIKGYQLSYKGIEQISKISSLQRLELQMDIVAYGRLDALKDLPHLEELKVSRAALNLKRVPPDLRAKVVPLP